MFQDPPIWSGKPGKNATYSLKTHVPWDPIDIEDLHKLAHKENFCPYYLNRMRSGKADIVLMPYNYIVDGRIRDRLKIDLRDDILIIDEAHNIPQVIEESSSFQLDTSILARVLKELKSIEEKRQVSNEIDLNDD